VPYRSVATWSLIIPAEQWTELNNPHGIMVGAICAANTISKLSLFEHINTYWHGSRWWLWGGLIIWQVGPDICYEFSRDALHSHRCTKWSDLQIDSDFITSWFQFYIYKVDNIPSIERMMVSAKEFLRNEHLYSNYSISHSCKEVAGLLVSQH
jgi:hypothetical protein